MTSQSEAVAKTGSILDRFYLSGKVALVTGGSRGIGRAISLALAEAGADIILASRKIADLEAVAVEIKQLGRRALPVAANVRHLPEIEGLVEKAAGKFGRIDILVNNAGTNPVFGSVLNIDEKVWDVILGLNLKGYFFLSQKVAGLMRQQGGGVIINVSSDAGVEPAVGLGVYSISKAGVIMLTRVLAQELGQYDIRVNAIAPGIVRTKFSEALWANPLISAEAADNTALKHVAEPEEIATAALYLASEASSHMTGETLVLDGGRFCSVRKLVKGLEPKTSEKK